MDPCTAIGLASSILAFVDLATQIVVGTYEVYKSATGATQENADINTIISDLREATYDLDSDLAGKTKHERALKELASNCEALSGELLRLLNGLTVSGGPSTWKSLKVKMKSMRKEKEVAGLEKRLQEYRSQILLRLTLMLNDRQSSIKVQLDRLENAGLSFSTESAKDLAKLREDILSAVGQLMQRKEHSEESAKATAGLKEVQDSLTALSSMISTVPRENTILRNLFFPSMNSREETIAIAEEGTFKWIFENEKEKDDMSGSVDGSDPDNQNQGGAREKELEQRARTRECLSTWLRAGGGVFHISGKAGSGKSTLMKFLCGNKRTEEELIAWAGEKKLVFARFFFWKSNDVMQMSLGGLYRSILFETLKRCPELVPVVFPTQWEQLGSGGPFVEEALLSTSTIQKAFEILIEKGTFPRHRFCFFIDGLDEYNGDSVDHMRLAKSLQLWASNEDVKICASSRPYLEYLKVSDSVDRRIHLHELTRHDIYLFSRQMIEKDENFEQIKDAYLELVDKVVERSEGVFLWARLVVRSLLAGILRHDTAQALEKKLEVIPRDLNEMYDSLLDSLEPDDRQRAIKMLFLTAHNPSWEPLSIVVYAWVDNLDDPRFPPTDGKKPSAWPPLNDITQNIQRQLTGLTKGLLETSLWKGSMFGDSPCLKTTVVKFYHRTVRDFVLENLKLGNIASQFPSLIKSDTYLRLLLAELTLAERQYRTAYWNDVSLYSDFKALFEVKMSVDLFNGFSRVFDDGDATVIEDPYGVCWGCKKGIGTLTNDGMLSFVHFAASTGQQEYVFQEILKNPELLNGNGELNILLSAAVSGKKDLVRALLERGSSPTAYVTCKPPFDVRINQKDTECQLPIWMILTGYVVGYCLRYQDELPEIFECFELFLRDDGVNASNCWFQMAEDYSSSLASHFITLKQFIQDYQPHNMDRLLALLNRDSSISYFDSTRRFLSGFTPFFKETESAVDKETSGYTRFHAGRDKRGMVLKSVICGDLKMDSINFRSY